MLTRILHSLVIAGIVVSVAPSGHIDITYPPAIVSDDAHVAEQLAILTDGLTCTPESEPRLVDHVIVHFTGTPVVAARSFDDAYRLATERKVEVLAYCDVK